MNMSKESLMESIIHDDDAKVIETLNNFNVALDESFLDYELLKSALDNNRGTIANFLLDKGYRVRNPNKILDETPFHLAMKLEDLSVISKILNKGASIYDKNFNSETPLYAAFNENRYEAVDAVLDHISSCNFSFNPNNKDDILFFHIACIRNHINSVKLCLSHGFDANRYLSLDSAEFFKLTPIQYLASEQHYGDLFKILLDHSNLSITNCDGLTPLHSIYCLRDNDIDDDWYGFSFHNTITQAFERGNDSKFTNVADSNGVSHFHLCCSIDRPDFVQVFIDRGVDINSSVSLNCSRDPGFTPLHFAIRYYGSLEVVELLLKNGADCNKSDKNRETPLHLACMYSEAEDRIKIIELLLEYNASLTAVNEAGNTPIHLAFSNVIYYRDFDTIDVNIIAVNILDVLLSKMLVPVNVTNKNGISLFHIVCTRNNINQVIDFLNSGVLIDSCVDDVAMYSGYTALHFAVFYNQKGVVEVLLKRNAQVNIKESVLKNTPLHLACQFTLVKFYDLQSKYYEENENIDLDFTLNRTNQLDIIKLLTLYGADVNAKNKSGQTPLFTAFGDASDDITERANRLIEIANILLSNKAKINDYANDQQTIFHVISTGYLTKISDELINLLTNAGADINAVDKERLTPLHLAAHRHKHKLVESFLKHKANVNATCKNYETPLAMAIQKYIYNENAYSQGEEMFFEEYYEPEHGKLCICILLKNGSDVNIKTQGGSTLFHDVVLYSIDTLIPEMLLYYGADINVEDSLGNSSVYSLRKKNGAVREDLSYIIFKHVQKLLALGLFVSDKVQKFCTYFQQYCKTSTSTTDYSKSLLNIFDECNNELNRMKIKKIDNYTSLYNILLKDRQQLSKHVRNKTLIDILKDEDIYEQFPLYEYLLKLQYKKGLLRSDVLKSAKASIIHAAGLYLPDHCCDSVFQYLTDEDIANVKTAVAINGRTKRKLNDHDNEPINQVTKNVVKSKRA